MTCSRCLSVFDHPLALHIEEEYFPIIDVVTGLPLPLLDEPGAFTIDEDHTIDLAELVRQYTLLAVPMKPLCRQDCAGLCPTCGHNLNGGPCSCSLQRQGQHWSELKKLVLREGGK